MGNLQIDIKCPAPSGRGLGKGASNHRPENSTKSPDNAHSRNVATSFSLRCTKRKIVEKTIKMRKYSVRCVIMNLPKEDSSSTNTCDYSTNNESIHARRGTANRRAEFKNNDTANEEDFEVKIGI